MSANHERRLAKLEATVATEPAVSWVTLFWRFGEERPVVPDGCRALIVRFVSPDDPPEWINLKEQVQ